MSSQYKYIGIDNRYFNIKKNPITLAFKLHLKHKRLRHLGFGKKRLVKFLIHRLCWFRKKTMVELLVPGDILLPVHNGYLVFNLQREIVTKVFTRDADLINVANEIERLKKISHLKCAPSLQRWNIDERWYEVDYVIGKSGWSIAPTNQAKFMEGYNRFIAPCIEDIITLQDPQNVKVAGYVKKIEDRLDWDELLSSKFDTRKIKSIKRFFDSTIEQLCSKKTSGVKLVFSHGDFLPLNILKTDDGISVIDWEHSDTRSALHDLYNYFFTQIFWNLELNLSSEIKEAISSMQSRLSSKSPCIANSFIPLSEVYRRLYYIERISLMLTRNLTEQLLDIILKSVYIFDRHEDLLRRDYKQHKLNYADYYINDTAGDFYEFVVYAKKSHSLYIFGLEEKWISNFFRKLSHTNDKLKHLDFACGTGRIISAVEALTDESVGLDLSPTMLSIAENKVAKADLRRGDILKMPNVVDYDYNVITAFRFFLNTEPEMRKAIMESLASRLRGSASRLIFNIHGNKNRPSLSKLRNAKTMSYKEVQHLVEEAGLEIESWYGFGVCSGRWHGGMLMPIIKFIDRLALSVPFVKRISIDLLFVCKPRV